MCLRCRPRRRASRCRQCSRGPQPWLRQRRRPQQSLHRLPLPRCRVRSVRCPTAATGCFRRRAFRRQARAWPHRRRRRHRQHRPLPGVVRRWASRRLRMAPQRRRVLPRRWLPPRRHHRRPQSSPRRRRPRRQPSHSSMALPFNRHRRSGDRRLRQAPLGLWPWRHRRQPLLQRPRHHRRRHRCRRPP